eukprot:6193800-Pleurochrysis_carterae.AAC.3
MHSIYVNVYGKDAILPHRLPMLFSLVQRIYNICDREYRGGKPWEPNLEESRVNYIGLLLIKLMRRMVIASAKL